MHRLLLIFLLTEVNPIPAQSQDLSVKKLQLIHLETETSIRAMEVLNESTVWFAGSRGIFGFTSDGGETWTIDTLEVDSLSSDLRCLAVLDEQTILLLNAGSPAYIWKSDDIGVTWKVVYENQEDDIFFDALRFTDASNGIAIGDPIHQCFQILTTTDGGETWQHASCNTIPQARGGEICFASSNTSVDFIDRTIWFATGALHTRIFSSDDKGLHWKAYEVPMLDGKEFTGIFSLDFYDRVNGVIAGGDYEDKAGKILTMSVTNDGGKTWKTVDEESAPPFVSCVQYRPNTGGQVILAACLPGIYYSDDSGQHWNKLKNENRKDIPGSFYTFRFSPSGKFAWFAGADGTIAKIEFN